MTEENKLYLLKETAEFNFVNEVDENGKKKVSPYGNMIVKGILQKANTVNQNGRIYPKDVLQREIENYRKLIKERRALGECVDRETEIYTKDGWKYIKDISSTEEIYTLNLKSNEIELQKIDRKIELDFDGELVCIKNNRSIDMVLTPNHSVVFWDRKGEQYKLLAESVSELINKNNSFIMHSKFSNKGIWKGNNQETFTIPETDITMPIKTWAGLFGLWIAEGHVHGSKGAVKKKNLVAITQKKENNIDLIKDLLSKTGIDWKVSIRKDGTHQFYIIDKNIHSYFKQFGNSSSKFIPKEFLSWTPEVLGEMLSWMLLGDGRNRLSRNRELIREYCTVSEQLSKDVEEIFFKIGSSAKINKRVQKDSCINGRVISKDDQKLLYIVSEWKSDPYISKYVSSETVKYNDKVYCVTVQNGTWLMRRNGKTAWTGNCDHAEEPVVNLKHTSHVITDVWWEGDVVMGQIEILEGMDQGRQVKTLFENGIKVGISSRAIGSVKTINGIHYVQDDLQLICWDFVSEPSTPGAFMFQEARLLSREELRKIQDSCTKTDRLNRIANEILGIKKI